MAESPPKYKSDLDKGFDPDDIKIMIKHELFAPFDVLKGVQDGTSDFDNYMDRLNEILKKRS